MWDWARYYGKKLKRSIADNLGGKFIIERVFNWWKIFQVTNKDD